MQAYKKNIAPFMDPNNLEAEIPSGFDYLKRRDVKISYFYDERKDIKIFLKLQFCEEDGDEDANEDANIVDKADANTDADDTDTDTDADADADHANADAVADDENGKDVVDMETDVSS